MLQSIFSLFCFLFICFQGKHSMLQTKCTPLRTKCHSNGDTAFVPLFVIFSSKMKIIQAKNM